MPYNLVVAFNFLDENHKSDHSNDCFSYAFNFQFYFYFSLRMFVHRDNLETSSQDVLIVFFYLLISFYLRLE